MPKKPATRLMHLNIGQAIVARDVMHKLGALGGPAYSCGRAYLCISLSPLEAVHVRHYSSGEVAVWKGSPECDTPRGYVEDYADPEAFGQAYGLIGRD